MHTEHVNRTINKFLEESKADIFTYQLKENKLY